MKVTILSDQIVTHEIRVLNKKTLKSRQISIDSHGKTTEEILNHIKKGLGELK